MSSWHGDSLQIIKKDGFDIADKIDSLFFTNRSTQRIKGVSALINGISQCVDREKPDVLLYVGDREEGIAAALVGNYMDVVFVHLAGGDPAWGNADDPIRFSISKLAHIHFTFLQEYSKNLLRIGEEEFRVFFSGNPSIDNIIRTKLIDKNLLSKKIGVNLEKSPYVVLLQHPLSSEKNESGKQMELTLEALSSFANKYDYKIIGIYPNTDPGSYDIIDAINLYSKSKSSLFFKNLKHSHFVNLLRHAKALIGNSSMGILESPTYMLPVVNVGNRQSGRINAGNVEFVAHDKNKIILALEKACFNSEYRQYVSKKNNPYGEGNASKIIADTLESIDLKDKKWFVKKKLC